MKPRLLDLFCGAGGAAMGYYRAGFEVVGVDIKPQKHYPFEFHQADAMTYPLDGFDVIHASPPCQGDSISTVMWREKKTYPKLTKLTRERLEASGRIYVLENVIGAPIFGFTLCGLMFALKVFRHRLFQSSALIFCPPHRSHNERIGTDGFCCVAGHGDSGRGKVNKEHRRIGAWKTAMGIDWMTKSEIVEAIPPAYTEFIGKQLMQHLL